MIWIAIDAARQVVQQCHVPASTPHISTRRVWTSKSSRLTPPHLTTTSLQKSLCSQWSQNGPKHVLPFVNAKMARTSQNEASAGSLVFHQGKKTVRLLKRESSPCDGLSSAASKPSRGKVVIRKSRAAPFAAMSLGGSATPGSQGSHHVGPAMPLFLIASASESKKTQIDPSAPAWRVAAGNLAAGAISGCAVEAALYPIDTIKTRLQLLVGGGGFKALLQQGGGKALYAGIWGNLAGVAPASAIFISVYEPVKKAAEAQLSQDQQYLGAVLAGMAAGTASSLVRVPTEVVKQRLQTKEFAGAVTAIRTIATREGVRGLYAGYGAFMLRDLPFDAIEFVAYEQLKKALSTYQKRELHPHETSIIGAMAGGFTGLVTTPLDVLKTRLMTQGSSGLYKNLFDATVKILQKEGPAAFMSGWQPRLIWISLGGFVFFPVLEATKKMFAPQPLTV